MNTGWNATQLIGARCDSSVCRAGAPGSHDAGSCCRFDSPLGVALSNSLCRALFFASRSKIYMFPVRRMKIDAQPVCDNISMGDLTFLCSRTMLVHFFSSSDSYFLAVATSKTSSLRFSSVLSMLAALGRSLAVKYAMMDLWL